MITHPVSGWRKVKIDGISTTISVFKININSSVMVVAVYFVLKEWIMEASINIRKIFINSLGWKLPIPGMTNQHLLLLISGANRSRERSKIFPMTYKTQAFLYKYSFFNLIRHDAQSSHF